jgi:hypothetical protein
MTASIVIIALVYLDTLAAVLDIVYTEKGIKAGVGVEGNKIVAFFSRTVKPGALFLYLWNFGFIGAVSMAVLSRNPGVLGMAAGVLIVDAVKHVLGARRWKALLSKKS